MCKNLLFLVAVAFCFSCTASFQVTHCVSPESRRSLPPGTSILVGMAADGSFKEKQYAGSGKTVTTEIVRALSRCIPKVEALQEPATIEEGMAQARVRGFTHFLQPTVLHWEDRATEWSGKRDKISIRLQVIELETGKELNSLVIDGKSKWATFGGDHPEDLLDVPLKRFAEQICP